MEVCVDCVESALEASEGGASRLELCSSLKCGGLTPTRGLLKRIKQQVKIPVYVMLRNRDGDFNYSNDDLAIMKSDAEDLMECGADGFVFGALQKDGSVNEKACEFILESCGSYPVTFHRAIDMSKDLKESLEKIISLGFKRVLTSGGKVNALEGSKRIEEMVNDFSEHIEIMPGGGITTSNLEQILRETGAKEFHASARKDVASEMTFINPSVCMSSNACDEYLRKSCSREIVRRMVEIYGRFK